MGSDANRLRKKWQDYSGKNAAIAELGIYDTFKILFEKTEFEIRKNPNEFSKIYVDIKLNKNEIREIYKPEKLIQKHGVFPDFAIDNKETGKTIYLEIKRQDGWIEGKEPNLPFWIIFQGDITRDPCRVREITCWFREYTANYFFWRNTENKLPLIEHFLKNIKLLLA